MALTAEEMLHVRRLFLGALDQPSAHRATWLEAQQPVTAAVFAQVRLQLRMLDSKPNELQSTELERRREHADPEYIADFMVVRRLGEGGMGVVYECEQVEPVQRRVAVKRIRTGLDSPTAITRFETERQALGRMAHPNIAKVFEADVDQDGHPYFAMELVDGQPITSFCDAQDLGLEARIELLVQVCRGMHHAHQRGIVHRDLKPANVLVIEVDGKPRPTIIDFGIAMALDADRRANRQTAAGAVIGTPEYMSPEQAQLGASLVDTRSDQYALGVLLFELLTGELPFDPSSAETAGIARMPRAGQASEPERPSSRVSGANGDRLAQGEHCQLTPRALAGRLRGDLDWITLRALQQEPDDRYESTSAFADDLERFLRHEPVRAGPPTVGYRLRKFVRRNRLAVGAVATVAVALVAGILGTSYGMFWAFDEKDRADALAIREATARRTAEENEHRATVARAKEAEARRRTEAINTFVIAALGSADPESSAGSPKMTIVAAMERAIADLDDGRLQSDPEVEAKLRTTIGIVLKNNGELAAAESQLARSLATLQGLIPGDHEDVATALDNLGSVLSARGRAAEAEPLCVQALAMHRRLFPGDHAAVAISTNNLARTLQNLGRNAEAVPLFEEALAMLRRLQIDEDVIVAATRLNLALARRDLGKLTSAEQLFERVLADLQRMYPGDHVHVAAALGGLASTRNALGRPAEAKPLAAASLTMSRRVFAGDHARIANGLSNLASVRQSLGHVAEAESLMTEAVEMRQRLSSGDHPDTATDLLKLAFLVRRRPAEAEPLYARALAMHQTALPRRPRRRQHRPRRTRRNA